MKYKTHAVGGLLAGVLTTNTIMAESLATKIPIVIFLGTSLLGSLFPDIDHQGSYMGRRAKITSSIVNKHFGHRGATHSPIAMFLFTLILYVVSSHLLRGYPAVLPVLQIGFIGFYVGILSHIFLDSLTKTGTPLLYPFKKFNISFTNAKTGGKFELFLRLVMSITLLYTFAEI